MRSDVRSVACLPRCRGWMPAALVALAFAAPVVAEESLRERAERLASLPPEQKEDVLSKKERFDALSPEQQARLRSLHQSIAATPNAAQLHATLSRYNDWLKTLSSAERAELLQLPCDDRIARIKEILNRQESVRFREFAGNLPEQDKAEIFRWLGEFIRKHEQELIDSTPWPYRQRLIDEPESRTRMLTWSVIRRGDEGKEHLYPSQEDFAELLPKLSEDTRREFDRRPEDQKVSAARDLVRAVVFSKFMPQVKEDDLRKFFSQLKTIDRERLEALDPDQMKRELTRMYHSEQFRSRMNKGGASFGPPGDGKRFGPPAGDGPRFSPRGDGSSRGSGLRRGPSGRGGSPPFGEGARRTGEEAPSQNN